LRSFARFQESMAYAGMINGLGQTLLKIACPGVPDFYQGSELWDYHLVDPDNRRPVDFGIRTRALKDLTSGETAGSRATASELWAAWPDGRVKLYVMWKALSCRRSFSSLFRDGEFLPLEVVGKRSQHIISFLRRKGKDQIMAVIPRWAMDLPRDSGESPQLEFWKGTNLRLPFESPGSWRNIFTSCVTQAEGEEGKKVLFVGELLKGFPVALLVPGAGLDRNIGVSH
jgi:(1->4)-alpha-D-glucan 1-alpha-D-glucosylmutase